MQQELPKCSTFNIIALKCRGIVHNCEGAVRLIKYLLWYKRKIFSQDQWGGMTRVPDISSLMLHYQGGLGKAVSIDSPARKKHLSSFIAGPVNVCKLRTLSTEYKQACVIHSTKSLWLVQVRQLWYAIKIVFIVLLFILVVTITNVRLERNLCT